LVTANAISWSGQTAFQSKAEASYTVDGAAGGTFKTEGNLSWLRVFGAGHEVPYYSKYTKGCIKETETDMFCYSTEACSSGFQADDAEEGYIFYLIIPETVLEDVCFAEYLRVFEYLVNYHAHHESSNNDVIKCLHCDLRYNCS
jgi:hypothetical protein